MGDTSISTFFLEANTILLAPEEKLKMFPRPGELK